MAVIAQHLNFPSDTTVFDTSTPNTIEATEESVRVGINDKTQELVYYYDPLTNELVQVGTGPGEVPLFFRFSVTFPNLVGPKPAPGVTDYFYTAINNTAVDYKNSLSGVRIDLTASTQHGDGFEEGDRLINVFEVNGTFFDDVIRGQDLQGITNDPGDNVLNGRDGSDVLEGRGGSDLLNGGLDFDYASYESSPAAVTVRLAGAPG